nr:NAD(P)/FAD-dependent oxidoreductase [uncultured Mediterraneibacter sp.]
MRTVVVAGGGASGMMAAITAAQNGARVILLEHKDRIGKKILSTGNGRCNFTNIHQEPVCYHSENEKFPWRIIEKFDVRSIISFFLQLGVYSKNRNGYIYPNSDQASAVLDALRIEIERLGIDVRTSTECREIRPGKKGFSILTNQGTVHADRVILSAGSKAAPSTGSDGSGYRIAKEMGHRIIPVLPALVQLRCREDFFKSIAGVRADGSVSIWADGRCIAKETGEIQLTNYGISGIPVFQVSRYAAKLLYDKQEVRAVLDFMPDFTKEQTVSFLSARAKTRPQKRADMFLIGLFHKKLSDLWLKLAGISREKEAGNLSDEEVKRLTLLVKEFGVSVTGTNSFEQAQVCRGGVDTLEIDPDTLESLYVPGLFFAGEILDVDGMCGGYNLSFAWASGYVAGKAAAGRQP